MIASILLCSLVSSSAFQAKPSSFAMKRSALQSADGEMASEMTAEVSSPTPAPKAATPAARRKAQWIPMNVNAPLMLDGTLAGDVGFDPLGFARSKSSLYWMREAEIKHARLAMLAAVGWPISELWHKEIAGAFGLESILQSGGRAPSLFNGGLSNVWASGMLVMSIVIAGYLEGKAMNSGEIFWNSEKPENYVPGDIGFDPLNLINVRGRDPRAMQTAEIKNGRLAMLAITGFAVAEFVNQQSVVSLTPFLF